MAFDPDFAPWLGLIMEKAISLKNLGSLCWVCVALLFFAQNARPAQPSDLASPDGRFRVEFHEGEAGYPGYLEIHDKADGRTLRINRNQIPLIGRFTHADVFWSMNSRFFILTNVTDVAFTGYAIAFDKNLSNVAVSNLAAGLKEGEQIAFYSIEAPNRVLINVTPSNGQTIRVLEVGEDGAVRGNVK